MSPRSSRPRRSSGFTVIEMLVTMISMAVILTVSGQLMFAMRRGLVRQQLQVEARQNVRAALDYTSMLLRGATDFNKASANAGAVLSWVFSESKCGGCTVPATILCGTQSGCYQTSFNNVTAANNTAALGIIADEGTDIITIGRPEGAMVTNAVSWPGYADAGEAGWLTPGCTAATAAASQAAFTAFKTATGGGTVSDTLVVAGDNGWTFYKISNYQDAGTANNFNSACIPRAACADASGISRTCILTIGNSGGPAGINPPGSHPTLVNPRLLTGTRFVTLRVRTNAATGVPWLEQKDGIIDPPRDNSGVNDTFVPILPNIEDMQIAWIFNDGTVRNDGTTQITATGAVPAAGGATPTDLQNVVGFRVTFTARSSQGMTVEPARFFRPAAEDHVASTNPRDTVYRYQASANAMIRNRMAGM